MFTPMNWTKAAYPTCLLARGSRYHRLAVLAHVSITAGMAPMSFAVTMGRPWVSRQRGQRIDRIDTVTLGDLINQHRILPTTNLQQV